MQNIGFNEPPVGGRKSSPQIRAMLEIAGDFEGLPEGTTKYNLLHLVKDVGPYAGFTRGMIALLEYYVMFTRDSDWAAGGRPIVYQSVVKTARYFGVSERQIQYLESALGNAGALTWHSSGNNKRFGYRHAESGELIDAYGVDLSPLGALRERLEKKKIERSTLDEAWYSAKRQISWYRGRIRGMLAEAGAIPRLQDLAIENQRAYEGINRHIRSYMTLNDLNDLLEAHIKLHDELKVGIEAQAPAAQNWEKNSDLTQNSSSTDDKEFVHIYSTNNSLSLKRDTSSPMDNAPKGSVADSSVDNPAQSSGGENGTGENADTVIDELARISWKQVLAAASDRFSAYLPLHNRVDWRDVVDAAYQMLPTLGISKSAWADACKVLDRQGAALCIIIIDQKAQAGQIRNPGGYLREMTARAQKGELKLHKSIFGLLKRGREQYDS